MRSIVQDIHYGLRILRRTPGFTAIAVLTLAIGVGSSTAVFGVINGVLLQPLPYRDPARILMLWRKTPPSVKIGYSEIPWNRYDFLEFQRSARSLAAVGAFKADSFNLTGAGEPKYLSGIRATAGFFESLGVNPLLGRMYTAEEDQPGHQGVVVLSEALWRDQFGADRGILGRAVDLNGAPYTVVGVMPASFAFPRAEEMPGSFDFPRQVQLWVPAALDRGPAIPAETSDYAVVARLKAGATVAEVQSELNTHERAMEAQFNGGKGWFHSEAAPLAQQVSASMKRPLMFLFCAVGIVLLIACSNVANLLLARSMSRQREFTLRAALGASSSRMIRQVLTESALLAVAGGAVALLVAQAAIQFAVKFAPQSIPRLHESRLDPGVFTFAFAASMLAGILFGLAPAVGAGRTNIAETLKQSGSRSIAGAGSRLRKALLVAEIAMALMLVIATGLVTRSFYRLLSVDPGFQAEHVLSFELSLAAAKYPNASTMASAYRDILQKLRAIPGVTSSGIVETVPMAGATEMTGLRIPGAGLELRRGLANYTVTSPGYLRAAGTPLLRGRDFRDSDDAASTPVTIINEAMAKKFWPSQDPIGKQVGPGSPKYPLATIIGITANVKHLSLRDDPPPEMYVLYSQKVYPSLLVMNVLLRAGVDPSSLVRSARLAVQSVDPDVPVSNIETLTDIVHDSTTPQRFAMLLLASFGLLALALASVGMYGLISHSVAQRTQEIGVRMALGARRQDVLTMILQQGARLALLGIAIGLATAAIAARLMASFLYGIRPHDAVTFITVPAILGAVALVACFLPALRATKVDPMVALRYE